MCVLNKNKEKTFLRPRYNDQEGVTRVKCILGRRNCWCKCSGGCRAGEKWRTGQEGGKERACHGGAEKRPI